MASSTPEARKLSISKTHLQLGFHVEPNFHQVLMVDTNPEETYMEGKWGNMRSGTACLPVTEAERLLSDLAEQILTGRTGQQKGLVKTGPGWAQALCCLLSCFSWKFCHLQLSVTWLYVNALPCQKKKKKIHDYSITSFLLVESEFQSLSVCSDQLDLEENYAQKS